MKKPLSVLAASAMLVVTVGTAAAADHRPAQAEAPEKYAFDVDELNDSGVDAEAQVQVRGDRVRVQVRVQGASADLPHAMHIHAGTECPPEEAAGDDGLLTVLEGAPFYGGIAQSLTTDGDASGDSALALDRFPVANRAGNFVYNRTFTVGDDIPASVVEDITSGHIVVHGFDTSGDGTYADSTAPLLGGNEATLPVACGEIG
jgi:hypothetical protein